MASQISPAPQFAFDWHGRLAKLTPSGGTTKLAQIWFDALSSVQRQTAVLPQAVPRFWQLVFVPGGSTAGGGDTGFFFFFFFFFFASAVAARPSDARAPAA